MHLFVTMTKKEEAYTMQANNLPNELQQSTGYIKRKTLSSRLTSMLSYPLVYVAAGPGYGKTTLVASVVSRINSPVIWLSLTPLDNNPDFFWKSLKIAADKALPSIGSVIASRKFPQTLQETSDFISDFSDCGDSDTENEKIVMVIDNMELLTEEKVISLIYYLQSINQVNSPFSIHMVIIADRQIPMIPTHPSPVTYTNLNSYQALTTKDLTFSRGEVVELMQIHGKPADDATIDNIMNTSEGWPYIVYSTATESTDNLGLIFGKVYNLFDRLYYSAFDELIKTLLVQLSVFRTFSLEIVLRLLPGDMKKEHHHAVEVLQSVPFIDYTFSDLNYRMLKPYQIFLSSRFPTLDETVRIQTLNVAGDYLFVHSDIQDIIDLYLNTQNYNAIKRCMVMLAKHHVSTGYVRKLLTSLMKIPNYYRKDHIWVDFFIALGYFKSDQLNRSKKAFTALLDTLLAKTETSDTRMFIGETYFALSIISLLQAEIFDLEIMKKIGDYLPDGSILTDSATYTIGENSLFFLPEDGSRGVEQMITYIKEFSKYFTAVSNGCLSGFDYLFEAEAYLYGGDLEKAVYCATQAVFKASMDKQNDIVLNAYHLMVRLSFAKGDYDSVRKYRRASDKYFEKHFSNALLDLKEIQDGFDHLHLNDIDSISDWIKRAELNRYSGKEQSRGRNILISAAYAVSNKEYSKFHALLNELKKIMDEHGFWNLRVNMHLQYAISYYHQNKPEKMDASFDAAYRMVYNDRLYYTVMEFGKLILPVLSAVQSRDDKKYDAGFLRFLDEKSREYAANTEKVASAYKKDTNIRPNNTLELTKKEQQVLLLLSQGLSRSEIAVNLGISVSGVQKFLSNIYLKLGAKNGTDAVSIAHAKKII